MGKEMHRPEEKHLMEEAPATNKRLSRVVLGTAQLGMEYGIANRVGRPDIKTAEAIIREAWQGGIREFDTAQAYGESEKVLGKCLRTLGLSGEARVISKLPPNLGGSDEKNIERAVERSLTRLGVDSLFGLLVHKESYLDQFHKGLEETLSKIIEKGLVRNIGISIYSPERALEALKKQVISIVQIPTNLLDRRFEAAGVFREAGQCNKQIYVRSIFLQGLLLMAPDEVPPGMRFAAPILERAGRLAKRSGLTREQLALGYVRQAHPEAKVIFGAETLEQVQENLKSWEMVLPDGISSQVQKDFGNVEDKILNPAAWPLHGKR